MSITTILSCTASTSASKEARKAFFDNIEDGKINAAEFDGLCKDVASLPRRFGLAPSCDAEYHTVERRTASRIAMFDMLDLRQDAPWVGLALSSL
jgi:hypothetical protein